MMTCRLVREPIAVERALAEIGDPGCGALVTFIGTVRNEHHGRRVLRLEYSAYDAMAVAKMDEIAAEVLRRHGARKVLIEHRLGKLEIGEASILIALAFPHRKESFDALRYAIDEFKTSVPIWKKEHFADGTAEWVEGS